MTSEVKYTNHQLKAFINTLRKRIWTIIIFLAVVMTVVVFGSFKSQKVYRATTKILIEKENPNVLSFKEVLAIDTTNRDYYQTQYKILKSRSLGEQVMEELSFDQNPAPMGFSAQIKSWFYDFPMVNEIRSLSDKGEPDQNEELRNRSKYSVYDILNSVSINPVRNSRLVDISVESWEPEAAAMIANTWAQKYIEQNLQSKLDASLKAVKWLSTQVEEMKGKVEESEMKLQTYKEEGNMVSLEDKQNIVVDKLAQLNTKVTEAKAKRINAEVIYRQVEDLLERGEPIETLPGVINNKLIQDLKRNYSQKEGELSESLQRYKDKHPKIISLRSELNTLKERIDREVSKILESIRTDYEVALSQEKKFQRELWVQEQRALDLNQKAITYGVIKREAESNKQLYDILIRRMKEATISGGVETNNIRVIDAAKTPSRPIRPRKMFNIILGLLVGLFFGSGLALVREQMDNSIKSEEDIRHHLKLPYLGHVPGLKLKKSGISADLYTYHFPKSIVAEAFRIIRTQIEYSINGLKNKRILITSAGPQEGKSFTSANLAIAIAQTGVKTLLIDCDLRKPSTHRGFNCPNDKGLSEILEKGLLLEACVRHTPQKDLYVLTSGHASSGPAELLGSQKMENFLVEAGKEYECLIIDSPPILPVTDSILLAGKVDGVVQVVRFGEMDRNIVSKVKSGLKGLGAPIIGVVLNKVNIENRGYYYSHYYYSYYDSSKGNGRSRKSKRRSRSSAGVGEHGKSTKNGGRS